MLMDQWGRGSYTLIVNLWMLKKFWNITLRSPYTVQLIR